MATHPTLLFSPIVAATSKLCLDGWWGLATDLIVREVRRARLPRRSLATARQPHSRVEQAHQSVLHHPRIVELTQKPVYELCEKCDERLRDDQRDWHEAERLLLDDPRIVAG